METSFLPKTLKRGARTGMQVRMIPTFNSIFPHTTNMVELPLPFEIMGISVIRKTEHTVVRIPRANTPMMPSFLDLSIRKP